MCHVKAGEMAYLRYQDVRATRIHTASNQECTVLKQHCSRWKTAHEQNMHVFPHAKYWGLDWYFSLAYVSALPYGMAASRNDDYQLPTFAQAALKENVSGKKKNLVSQKWGQQYAKVLKFFEEVSRTRLCCYVFLDAYLSKIHF